VGNERADLEALQKRIADLERREAEAREKLGLYERIFDALPDLVAAKDGAARLLFANRAYREFYGLKSEAVAGRTEEELGLAGASRRAEWTQRSFAGNLMDIPSEDLRRHDGLSLAFHILCAPLSDERGAPAGAVESARAIRGDDPRRGSGALHRPRYLGGEEGRGAAPGRRGAVPGF